VEAGITTIGVVVIQGTRTNTKEETMMDTKARNQNIIITIELI
jgi:hypothetical protein